MNFADFFARLRLILESDTPRARATLEYITQLIDGTAVLPGGIKRLMAELGCTVVDAEITDALFPDSDAFASTADIQPMEICSGWLEGQKITEADLRSRLDAKGLDPANADEGLKWVAENRGQLKCPLMIFSHNRVIEMRKNEDTGNLRVWLSVLPTWIPHRCVVLAKPKKSVPAT